MDELVKEPTDISIDKYRMSGFHDTCLDSVLRHLDITTILFAGVNADQCVLATLMDANFAGYGLAAAVRPFTRHTQHGPDPALLPDHHGAG